MSNQPKLTLPDFIEYLENNDACPSALDWIDEQVAAGVTDPATLWNITERGDWIWWILDLLSIRSPEIVQALRVYDEAIDQALRVRAEATAPALRVRAEAIDQARRVCAEAIDQARRVGDEATAPARRQLADDLRAIVTWETIEAKIIENL
jgi:cell division septum initiation protein DivIVA